MLTSTKLGRELGLTKGTVCTLARDGRIPFIQLPSGHRRFDLEAVKDALSSDVMSATFLPPISSFNVEDRHRILFDAWKAARRKIEMLPPVEKNDTEEADRRNRALARLDKRYEKESGALTMAPSAEKGGK